MSLDLRGSRRLQRRAALVLMAAYLLVVAGIVFAPSADVPSRSVWWIWGHLRALGFGAWLTTSEVEFATNVLLFVPLGFLGYVLRPRWGWLGWTLVGLAASGFIELTQLVLLSARSATLVDVASNTLGALLGACTAAAIRHTMER